jgi:hypothetical protein
MTSTYNTQQAASRGAVRTLARKEVARYTRHPLFLFGVVLTALPSVLGPDERTSSLFHVIAPAAGLGLFGLLVLAGLTRSSDRAATATGSPVVDLRTRTLALAAASLVPFAVGLLWFAWAVWAYNTNPPPADGLPFGPVGDAWALSVLFALGPMASLGGPILGLVLARWVRARWAPALAAVALLLSTIVMQGLFEPLRTVRLVMPWTYFGGPFGVPGDAERMLVLVGSPQWYIAYLVMLCVAGVLLALLRDRDADRRPLAIALGVALAAAAICTGLAMTTGVEQTLVNPVPSST